MQDVDYAIIDSTESEFRAKSILNLIPVISAKEFDDTADESFPDYFRT